MASVERKRRIEPIKIEYENASKAQRALPRSYDWSAYERPPITEPPAEFCKRDLTLMMTKIDYCIVHAHPQRDGYENDQSVPILRVYATTDDDPLDPKVPPRKALVKVHGFFPYFYCAIPAGMDINNPFHMKDFYDRLEYLHQSARALRRDRGGYVGRAVLGVEPIELKHGLGLQLSKTTLLKVTFAVPQLVATTRKMFELGNYLWTSHGSCTHQKIQCYEANVPFVLRYMINAKITGASWFTIPANKFAMYSNAEHNASNCQIEVDVYWRDIVVHSSNTEDRWMKIPRLRLVSFDIEYTFIVLEFTN